MPVIDSRNFNSFYDTVSARLSIKAEGKRTKKKNLERVSPTASKKPKAKETILHGNPLNEIFEKKNANFYNSSTASSSIRSHTTGSKETKTEKKHSIVSGSQKLKDLQELHKELSKSSHESAKPSGMDLKPRKPTMESIRSAIAKAKQKLSEDATSKSVGTDDYKTYILTSEASTSTRQSTKTKKNKKKKKVAKKSSGESSKKKAKKKKTVDVKIKTKVKVDAEKKMKV